MVKSKKKAIIRYFSLVLYIFLIAFIILTGNKKTKIVTSNINNVKSIQSNRILHEYENGDIKTFSYAKFKMVNNINDVKKYGKDYKIEFIGTLTGYGPDCPGCGGHVACSPNPDVPNGNIYYTDKEYGKIRIVAADKSNPCGSIVHIKNYKFAENGEFIGIVLDRGSSIVGLTMDLLYPSEQDTVIIGRQYNIDFNIKRWGW